MKVLVVHIGDVLKCPPVLNLIHMLQDLNINTHLIFTKSEYIEKEKKCLSTFMLPCDYEQPRSLLEKLTNMLYLRRIIWNYLDENCGDEDVIWVTSDTALKHIGNKIINKRYILQFMELSEDIRYYNRLPIKMNATLLGNKAIAVVVPEYNRAHITKAWWNLKKMPFVLENKPYNSEKVQRNSKICDSTAEKIIKRIGNRKIILYQGIIHKERPLDQYIKAVDKMGDKYAFVVMSSGDNIYSEIKSSNYFFIPYIKSPQHLQVTSHAFIGVLSYFPTQSQYSILNALYCAPNKTFEYAMFGIPMIGNDVPGLKYVFSTSGSGICVKDFNVDNIINAIKTIEENYEIMSEHSLNYYNSVDSITQLKHILSVVE